MKYAKQILTILLLFTFTFVEISAQTVKLKRDAQSSGTLGTIPAGTFPIYSGLQTVAKGMKVYLAADTAGGVTSITWTLVSQPAGSNTALSSTTDQKVTFVPDSTGYYIVKVEVNGGAFAQDTLLAATYLGYKDGEVLGCLCHNLTSGRDWQTVIPKWKASGHATIFKEGITGQLEAANVNGLFKGMYGPNCIKCHTTGWEPNVDNGNFGYEAKASGFDTTWFKTYTKSGSSYLIPTNDMTAWNMLTTDSKYSEAARVAFIGCESCHGPASAHQASYGNPNMISKSLDAGVCNQCHDAPTHHMVGHYYNASAHATLPHLEARTSCFPCHGGTAYYKYTKNPTAPNWVNEDATPISCAVCHVAHEVNDNFGLRIVPVKLQNGYSISEGGNGQLCMTCHQSRSDISTVVTDTPPYYGFVDRYGPHHGPQSDMYLGRNAYNYGNTTLDGLMTHGAVKDACVTCHLAPRGDSQTPNHEFTMVDTTGGQEKDLVAACVNCHGPITSFDDIMASSDLDGNGKIEGVQTEVKGMLTNLADMLPKDASGNVVSRMSDSLKVKNKPNVVKGIYTYYFVSEDRSMGVHNAKYTIGIISAALKALGSEVPVEMTSFNASASAESVTLKWETATETNNNGFDVERKATNNWEKIGFVKGNGTSSQFSKYSFNDNVRGLNAQKASYRLKQVDFDGTFKYSKEVEVTLIAGPREYSLSQNYPNPFNPSTTISYSLPFESNIKISIYNITGQLIKVLVNGEQPIGNHQVLFSTNSNGEQLSSGIYFYTIEASALDGSSSFRQTKKMVLMK
jgi:Secretion system C-terminal sorting domain